MIRRIKEWLGRENSPLVRYVNAQVKAVTLSDTGEPCPVCLHTRLFLIPLVIGIVIGIALMGVFSYGLQLW